MKQLRLPRTRTPAELAAERRQVGTPDQHALALRIARSYSRHLPQNIECQELENVALAGLWDGLQRRTDASLPYLTWRIRGHIRDELRNQDVLRRKTRTAVRRGEEPDITRVPEWVAYEVAEDIDLEADLDRKRMMEMLHGAMAVAPLTCKQQVAVVRHMEGKTQKVTSVELGVTEARVCQLLKESVRKMRAVLGVGA